jgi:hypothetical protein
MLLMAQNSFSMRLALILGGCLLLAACAGPRRLVIRNDTGEKAFVAWGLRPSPKANQPDTYSRVDTLYAPLDNKGPERQTGLVFGEGPWNVNEYHRAAERLAFIEVVNEQDSVLFYLSHSDSLEMLLADAVHGLRKREVLVVVK